MSCNKVLKSNGHKLTPQRKLILDIIHAADAHLTADDIIGTVQARMPGVNKSTIYRTLELLENLDCVFRSESDGRSIYHHAEHGHHHHVQCTGCGKTFDCGDDLFLPVQDSLISKYGFHGDFRHMVVTGKCSTCKGMILPPR